MPGISDVVRFGSFEVDLARAELRKSGLRIRLQEQPFIVLAALLERPGEVVSREELIRRLWPDGTVVDFDRGLNAAVTRLRQALSDSAEAPRYVETVARRGYRFVAELQSAAKPSDPAPATSAPVSHARKWLAGISLLVLAAVAAWWAFGRGPRREPGTSIKITPLTSAAGVESDPSFSPDGTQVVYEWNRDGTRHLYLKTVGPGDPIPLTAGEGAEYGPAWSPDGKWIAFVGRQQNAWGIYEIAPVGGTPRKVADIGPLPLLVLRRPYRHLDWTKDSRHIIASVTGQGMWETLLLVSTETGQTSWLTSPVDDVMSGDREPAVSPDGSAVVFARGAGDSEHLYTLPLTADLRPAGPPRPIEAAGPARSPAWTPDGRALIFTNLNPGVTTGWALAWLDLAAGSSRRSLAALGHRAATAVVSRRGTLAFSTVSGEGTIWRQEIPPEGQPAPPPVKVNSAATIQFGPVYSPDGSRIAFSSERSGTREIWNCASDGYPCLQVTSGGYKAAELARWSPDGTQIVYGAMTGPLWDAYVVDAKGGPPRKLTSDTSHGGYPYWSHDGKWIYYSPVDGGRHTLWKLPASGGTPIPVNRFHGHIVVDSPDSQTLYYFDGTKLFRSAADGSGETELLNDVALWSFAVARDRIYYIHEDSDGVNEIRQLVLATRKNSRVCRIDKTLTLGLDLSPDGKFLLYAELLRRGNVMIGDNVY